MKIMPEIQVSCCALCLYLVHPWDMDYPSCGKDVNICFDPDMPGFPRERWLEYEGGGEYPWDDLIHEACPLEDAPPV